MQIHEHYAKTNHKIEKLYHAAHHISLVTNDLVGAGAAAGRAGVLNMALAKFVEF